VAPLEKDTISMLILNSQRKRARNSYSARRINTTIGEYPGSGLLMSR